MEEKFYSGSSAKEIFSGPRGLSYSDIIVLDTFFSEVNSEEIDFSSELGKGIILKNPIISSPMDTVTESKMAIAIALNGGIGVIHNNCTVEFQANEVKIVKDFENKNLNVLFACGTNPEKDYERIEKCFNSRADGVIVDTSQGNTSRSLDMIRYIKSNYPNKLLIGGNVSTKEGCKNLIGAGVDVVRVGQAIGSICTTTETLGIGRTQATAVYECAKYCKEKNIPIIADGGIKSSGDILRAFALGARFVMLGNLLARCEESSGKIITNSSGRVIKKYRGMGSRDVIDNNIGIREYSIEPQGISAEVPLYGSVEKFIEEKMDSLKKSFRVVNCKNIEKLHEKLYSGLLRFEKLSDSGLIELGAHSIV